MTVNFIECSQHLGEGYAIMVRFVLPFVWSRGDISGFQVGLARALARVFNVNIGDVFVFTQVIG
jgi:hypothetical protein